MRRGARQESRRWHRGGSRTTPAQSVHVTDDRDGGSGEGDQGGETLAIDAVDLLAMDALADEQGRNPAASGARHVGRQAVANGKDLIELEVAAENLARLGKRCAVD